MIWLAKIFLRFQIKIKFTHLKENYFRQGDVQRMKKKRLKKILIDKMKWKLDMKIIINLNCFKNMSMKFPQIHKIIWVKIWFFLIWINCLFSQLILKVLLILLELARLSFMYCILLIKNSINCPILLINLN